MSAQPPVVINIREQELLRSGAALAKSVGAASQAMWVTIAGKAFSMSLTKATHLRNKFETE